MGEGLANPLREEFDRLENKSAYRWVYPWEHPGMDASIAEDIKRIYAALVPGAQPRKMMIANEDHWRLSQRYSWAIPNETALLVLAQYAPLIEIGAGVGYWAWMLRARGVDIVAYDKAIQDGKNMSGWHQAEDKSQYPLWAEVLRGTQTALDAHPDRTLFLCWPPNDTPMARYTLQRYKGEYFVYIGEPHDIHDDEIGHYGKGCNGDEEFFELLHEQFQLIRTVRIPRWENLHDRMEIWKRKKTKFSRSKHSSASEPTKQSSGSPYRTPRSA